MRNLIINQIHKEKLFKENNKILYSIFDEINNNILLICSNMKIYFFSYKMFNYSKIEKEIEIESYLLNNSDLCLKIMTEIENNNNPFIYLLFKSESDSLIIVLKTGEIITFDLNNQTSKIKIFSSKIITFEPNPNQNNIILILSNFTLLNLNYDTLEIINKCILDDEDLSDYKKDLECSEAQISFRNNGELFTSIFKINDGFKNLVRDSNSLKIIKGPARADNKIVFSVAEAPLDYLSCNVAFMPNGSLIAFYDRKKGKIIFSEKNCLIHGEFKIVFNDEIKDLNKIKVLILKWNFFSSMILFVFEYENKFYIQIYNRSNYEWTLKYEIFSLKKVLNCKFSENNENQMLILFENNIFQIVDFIWEFSSSLNYNNNFNDNFGEIVVNFNNSKLKYTPIGKINVPPPLCLKTIENSKGKKFLWFRKFFFAVDEKNIEVYKSDFKEFFLFSKLEIKNVNFNIENVKKIIFIPIFNENFGIFVFNLIIDDDLNSEKLLFLFYEIEYKNFVIEKIKNEPKKIFEKKIENINKIIIFNSNKFEKNYENEFYDENNILSKNTQIEKNQEKKEEKFGLDLLENFNSNSNSNQNQNEIYFYLTGFDLNSNEQIFTKISLNLTNNNLIENSLNFSHNKNEKIISIKSSLIFKKEEIIIYLTNNNNLYQNGNLLSNNINSFIIFKHFLLFIQNSSSIFSQLHIIDLNDDEIKKKLNNNNLYVQNLSYKNFNMRTLERGSSIVTCSNIKLILQLPRGNLETINLRLIVLDEVKKLLLNKKFDEAFYICKKNKINLNFIYDLNPNFFMNNLNVFVNKINKVDDINLFINSLINEKCDEYKILFNENNNNNNNNNEKINNICIKIRKILFDLNNDDYISSILITFTKQNPPLYLNALQLIQKLKKEKKNSLAEKSLEFLCWIVNAETLFDFSLKTYDFELVIMCAKYTQKDPKEYLNYLNNLQEIKKKDPILMKYQINLDLKNYTDALIEISKGGEKFFDKCVELIEKYELYDLALKLFNKPEFNNLFIKINELKGDFYYNKKNLEKSCLCYLNSNNFEKAFNCYKEIGKINEAISLLFNLKKNNKENIYNILNDLINDCRIKKLENEIEKIYLFLINNIKIFTNEEIKNLILNLIESLINNKKFSFCYFIYINITNILKEDEKYKLIINEIEKKFLNKINLSFDLIFNSLKTNFNFFNEKFNRFEIVQQLKKEHPEKFIIDLNKNDNEIDNVSDSGSVRSSSSKKSSSSKYSKSKKKKKTIKKNIKEGSPFEEENLIEILKDLKIDEKEINKINELIDVLILVKFNEKSDELNKLKDDYVKNVNNKINKMFLIEQIKFANEHPEINDLFPQLNLSSIINNSNDNNNNINIINIKNKI